ncbi:probable nucleoredoxin 1 [Selaginella moellendorffii]|nr:probable nucleoredoxin 1 [Selaginella moellendorffii]|eukprot:XP_002965590.2 probable nucleoredoxin 1 [Selaginella moellendorffii]
MAGKLLHSVNLIDARSGESIKAADALRNKVTLLAIAPHWLPMPLRQTMASLVEVVDELQQQGKEIALVYVAVDRDEDMIANLKARGNDRVLDDRPSQECFDDLRKQMSQGWMAVPLEDSATRESLLKDLRSGAGIFHLAVIGEDGEVLTQDGLDVIYKWGAEGFPFSDERIQALEKEAEERKANQSLKSLLVSPDRDFVIANDGSKVKVESLEGKIVALYFSGHWCGPCRSFTPVLARLYKQLKDKGEEFEVVFVSADNDEDAFEEYHKEMPWLAIPFSDSKTRKQLDRIFDIGGIPSLVVLGKDGKTVHTDAVQLVSKHGVDAYPFTPEKLDEIKAEQEKRRAQQTLDSLLVSNSRDFVVTHDGKEVKISELKGKTVGLYFSAHWCPPCRGFTPELVQVYNELKQKNAEFEIIFVSSDRDEGAFKSYFASMPWLALPFSDRESKSELSSYFEVEGIPTLVILGPDGKTLTAAGRRLVGAYKAAAFPFTGSHIEALKSKEMEEANAVAAQLPKEITHSSHPEHPLALVVSAYKGPYGCDVCDQDGTGWVYHCAECSFDIHPKCAKPEIEKKKAEEQEGGGAKKEGWVCEGDVCKKN